MALHKSRAVVIGRRPLGESDRLVELYARDFGKVRGVAKGARRPRSRFGSALELLTLGEVVFFDTGRTDLVRIDHFDIVHPFVRVREELERLGQAGWMVECLSRLTAERDPQPALYGLLVRSLRALEGRASPRRIAAGFAARAIDLLGHRPRLDRCVVCGRPAPFEGAVLDMGDGGLVCGRCPPGGSALVLSGAAVGTLRRIRELRWEEILRLPLAPELDRELCVVLQDAMAALIGEPPRSLRFLSQTRRALSRVAEPGSR